MAAEVFNLNIDHGGGWLIGLSEDLKNYENNSLHIIFFHNNINSLEIHHIDNITYYAIPKKIMDPCKYEPNVETYLQGVIKAVNPDIIHIFGTEYPHTLAMMNVCPVDRTVVSIQGLVSVYSRHYISNLSFFMQPNSRIIKNYLRKKMILRQQKRFEIRGLFEVEALKKAKHVIGRTTWDYACTKQINKNVNYYFCNETLRGEFYKHKWTIDNCERFSIFVSQGVYPIKGLHIILQALSEILKFYPQAHLYIAGADITKGKSLTDRVGISYGQYIRELIEELQLIKHITFTGELNEKAMCMQFLKAHVFVSASSIENSPNSLGEAMILGVPSVSSCVGGVQDMLSHKEEGYLYPFDESYMLAHYVCEVFSNDEISLKLSERATKRALTTHNRENNLINLMKIYREIIKYN
ncbi:glycosyltransferase family 4 protein [Paenibacillus sp. EPM92]|uniref:glycosyltransferase family 4 protein n=1 Tax=Paenibacillus sp. EPM92 TaxID=1561195 RepID=UPI001F3709DE|nr:glycosyltransferase [Paenibacillus sp. EPM92]